MVHIFAKILSRMQSKHNGDEMILKSVQYNIECKLRLYDYVYFLTTGNPYILTKIIAILYSKMYIGQVRNPIHIKMNNGEI